MTSPSVSVALCTYNGARYVADQLRSILAQTVAIDQLVVSDDGSTDETLEIIQQLWSENTPPRAELTVLRNRTALGVTANFAQALTACDGELIVLCDQDDVWRSDRVAVAVEAFRLQPDLLLLHTNARLVDSDGAGLGLTLFEALEVAPDDLARERSGQAFALLLRRNLVTGATVCLHSRLLAPALPIPAGWVHDEWLALVAAAIGRIDVVDEALVDYRQHGSNQIGVSAPTLTYKVHRMFQPRADRNATLAQRARALRERLTRLDAPSDLRALAEGKERFEAARAALPSRRLSRVRSVVALARTGAYTRFASQGALDIVRDLLQPA